MIKQVPKKIDLEFEIGKTYKTKFQTGELFTINKIVTRPFLNTVKVIGFMGIYEKAPHLGDCPITPDRLIPDQETVMEDVEICECCGKEISN